MGTVNSHQVQTVNSAGGLGLGNSENSVASGLGGSTSGATLDRPGTTQRSGGRVAMTVLRPQQQQQQASTTLPQLPTPSTAQQAQQGAAVPPLPGAAPRSPRRSLIGAKQVDFCTVLLCVAACACMTAAQAALDN